MLKALVAVMVVVAVATPGYAQTQQERDSETRDRQQFVIFMGELRQAVQNGAGALLRQVHAISPNAALGFTGSTDVEGYRLDDVGLFFRVRVPDIKPSNIIAIQLLNGNLPRQQRPTPTVTPAGFNPSPTPGVSASTAEAAAPPSPFLDDPDAVYTSGVQTALVTTMLERSRELRVAPGQYLIVAARSLAGEPDLRFPDSYREFHTVYFRIKSEDLASYHAGRTTLEQAQKLVSIKED